MSSIMSLELLGFSHFSDITHFRLQVLIKKYGDLAAAWRSLQIEDLILLRIAPERAQAIYAKKQTLQLEQYAEQLKKQSIHTVGFFDDPYPQQLKEIYNPPLLLYCKGSHPIPTDGIAVVGTRHPSVYGSKATAELVRELAPAKVPIISGLAAGIDTIAHHTAIETHGPTIAVLGTGLDLRYPPENTKLFEQIVETGLLISEYPLATKPMKWHFPHRNRIITGLARAVCVMEGALTSGAMITGKLALDQNRDVYALPGQIFATTAAGPNWLISQGARAIINIAETAQELTGKQLSFQPRTLWPDLNTNEKIIYDYLSDMPLQLDTLLEKTNIPYTIFMQDIIKMQLKGLISELPGKRLVRT